MRGRQGQGRSEESPLPVLMVLHGEDSSSGRIGQVLRDRGHSLDIRRPRYGDLLPETLADHAGTVIFGGPMSANDPDDYIKTEIDWIGVALEEEKPFLGVCLGAQMLAKHLGARVEHHPEQWVEVGYCPIRPTAAGGAYGPWPEQVYHWHREGFELPSGAVALAEGPTFPNQAMAYGQAALGVQFHPEMTYALLVRWSSDASYREGLRGAQSREAQLTGHIRYGVSVKDWLDRFIELWLATPMSRVAAAKPGKALTGLQPALACAPVPAAE